MKDTNRIYLPISVIIVLFILLLFIMFPGILSLSMRSGSSADYPTAVGGILDLRQWDFARFGPVPLNGEWEFYWQELLDPAFDPGSGLAVTGRSAAGTAADSADTGISGAVQTGVPTFAPVPGTWNSLHVSGKALPPTGYATYRLTVLYNTPPADPAVRTLSMGTTFTLFAGTERVVQAGISGTSPNESVPGYKPSAAALAVDEEAGSIKLQLHVSNYDYRIGGPWRQIWFGSLNTLDRWRWQAEVRSIMLFSSLMMMAFYHVALFLMRRKDSYFLYLALFCMCLSFRALFPTEYTIVRLFPAIPFALLVRMEYLTFFLAIPAAGYLYRSLYPDEFFPPVAHAVLGISGLFSLVVLVTPPLTFTHIIFAFYVFSGVVICYLVIVNALAVMHKRQGSAFTIVGTLFMAIATVNDNLYSSFFINTGTFIELGMVIFVFLQALTLSLRLTGAFSKVEVLTESLASMNDGLEAEVARRSRELQEASESVRNLEMIRSADEERKRLGRDLHDGMGQSVHALELLVAGFASSVSLTPVEQEKLRKINTAAVDVKNGLYQVVGELYPVSEGDFGLVAAVEKLAARTEIYYGVPVTVYCSQKIIPCSERTANDIYYIVSEALHNAVKHADPDTVDINLKYEKGGLVINIANNGVRPGAAVGSAAGSEGDRGTAQDQHLMGGNGLRIMKYRSISHGGTFRAGILNVADDSRFEVTAAIPFQDENPGTRGASENKRGPVE